MILNRLFKVLVSATRGDKLRNAKALFDAHFYTATYPDIVLSKVDAFEHYLLVGWREGRNPSAIFDTAYYLDANPDVHAAGLCPLVHYANHGAKEGRLPARRVADLDTPLEKARMRFDPLYYLSTYSDIAEAGVDPFRHYTETGWREKRDPSPTFSTRFYLESNPDVRQLDVCPLIHYAVQGESEGRLGRAPPDHGRRAIDEAIPARDRAKLWRRSIETGSNSIADLSDAMHMFLSLSPRGLVVVMSHDDYAENNGGIQNVVGDEQAAFNSAGFSYLHLCPAQPLPILAIGSLESEFLVSLRLDGERLGVASVANLCAAMANIVALVKVRHFIIHHLLGFQPNAVKRLIQSINPCNTIHWVHDFFDICVNPHLMRNDVAFCGAPPLDSNACQICIYGDERHDHLAAMRELFDTIRPVVLCPSESALEFWRDRAGLAYSKLQVFSHGRLEFDGEKQPTSEHVGRERLRVAFLGTPVYHKGWGAFQALAATRVYDKRYEFFYFGKAAPEVLGNIFHIPVEVSRFDRNAMVNAIMMHEIDVAILWSLWPETFCFTVHEAIAGGAFVVTRGAAGNIWPSISRAGISCGVALETELELHKLFETGQIFTFLNQRRIGRFCVVPASFEYLLGGQAS
jgi:hypothetical protein